MAKSVDLAKLFGPPGAAADPAGPSSADAAKDAAASEMMAAIHSKDEAGLRAALQSFFDAAESVPHDEAPAAGE